MKYKCKTSSLNQLMVDFKGVVLGLCDLCGCVDCSNPIENREVSIMGITKECKVFSKGNDASFVISCEGYIENAK